MKIGIITLPLHTNYGGILQAYALQTVLKRMGHNVVVFDTPNNIPIFTWKLPLKFMKRCLCKFILRKPTRIFYEQWYNQTHSAICQYTQRFIDKYINRLEVSSFKNIRSNQFDAFVVGSDQVWRPIYFTQMFSTRIENAFLDFAKNWDVKRISYAASFGTEDWEYSEKQTKKCGELLRLFDFVSVREKSGVHMCKEKFSVNAYHVLDPTMLLESTDYIALVEKVNSPKSFGNMLCYILDNTEEKLNIINRVAEEKKLTPFRVNSEVEDVQLDVKKRIQPPVESWIRGFYDAEFVVTDSFHACVFSILFKKPFIVIGNKERGIARLESLLAMFGLQNRLISSFNASVVSEEIDWDSVYKILEEKRTLSQSILSEISK